MFRIGFNAMNLSDFLIVAFSLADYDQTVRRATLVELVSEEANKHSYFFATNVSSIVDSSGSIWPILPNNRVRLAVQIL